MEKRLNSSKNISNCYYSTSENYLDKSKGYSTKSPDHQNTHQVHNSRDSSQSMEKNDVHGGYSVEVKKKAIIEHYDQKIKEIMDDKKSHSLRKSVLLYNAIGVMLDSLDKQ